MGVWGNGMGILVWGLLYGKGMVWGSRVRFVIVVGFLNEDRLPEFTEIYKTVHIAPTDTAHTRDTREYQQHTGSYTYMHML